MGDLLAQRLHVSAFAANQDDEVVGVAHDPPVRFAFADTCAALIPSRHRPAGFPRRVLMLIEHRQRNVGQQRGEDSSNAVGNLVMIRPPGWCRRCWLVCGGREWSAGW